LKLLFHFFLAYISHDSANFSLQTCSVDRLSDWYTLFSNPSNNYCSSESVYPLWSLPISFYGFAAIITVVLRTILSNQLCKRTGSKSIYFALYLYPGLVLIQVVLGGLQYYAFPYIILVASLTFDIIYFVLYGKKIVLKPTLLFHSFLRYIFSVYAIVCLIMYFNGSLLWLVAAFGFPLLATIVYIIVMKIPWKKQNTR